MMEFNENDFIQANSNATSGTVTIELTMHVNFSDSSMGSQLISVRKSDFDHFIEAINVLEGRRICVGEEWNYRELTINDWRRIYQYHVRGGTIDEMELDYFKKVYFQFIRNIRTPKEQYDWKVKFKQVWGIREYNLADTKDQFNTKYELDEQKIEKYNPLEIENIITAYRHKNENYYFDDPMKYYGLFLSFG
jgi:hypothetical protein